ncbi:hypothetical protein HDU98_003531 [Podochytrium sp. JEL0797]|nr:hypothetical protein HDU98_003531 [Podochytrium sp. JEL0797]
MPEATTPLDADLAAPDVAALTGLLLDNGEVAAAAEEECVAARQDDSTAAAASAKRTSRLSFFNFAAAEKDDAKKANRMSSMFAGVKSALAPGTMSVGGVKMDENAKKEMDEAFEGLEFEIKF